MNIEEAREYCLEKLGCNESFPFDEETLVFKVVSKMFAVISLERQPASIVLKCEPDYSVRLREEFNGISSAYHFNKLHWNAVTLCEDIPDSMIHDLINMSYDLVYAKLTRKEKESLVVN